MKRRSFLSNGMAMGLIPFSFETSQEIYTTEEVVAENPQSGPLCNGQCSGISLPDGWWSTALEK